MTKTVTISYEDFQLSLEVDQEFTEDKMLNLLTRYYSFMNELAELGMNVEDFTQQEVDIIGAILLVEEFTNIVFPGDAKEILDSGLVLWETNNLEKILNQFPESEITKLGDYFKLFEYYRKNQFAKEEGIVSC